ncbi:thioredoxin family protein [Pseudomonadota bacterium]
MARATSTMLELGTKAPTFKLPNTNADVGSSTVTFSDYADMSNVLVMFICNHCPYVVHIRTDLVNFVKEYQNKGVGVIAISSNDATNFPGDSPFRMQLEAAQHGYSFPYLYDEDQTVAKAYQAICTPDFYLFDANRTLVYRGQFDGSRPNNRVPISGVDLRAACDAVLLNQSVSQQQYPSVGCSIKWKFGNEPDYY